MIETKFRFYIPKFREMYDVTGIDFEKKIVFTSKWPKGIQINSGNLIQFTGLKDKNDKEIYEGDIIDYSNGNCILIIIWNKSWGKFEYEILKKKDENIGYDIRMGRLDCYAKVIGNKYKNPELLKEVKKK